MTAVEGAPAAPDADDPDVERTANWTSATRRYVERFWPYDRLMPSDEPVYVVKAFYLFGSLALMAFVSLIVTGVVLTVKGPLWWHTSQAGLFFNSLHFWSVQVFFFTVFVHFGASFFAAAWRGGRGLTWLFGGLGFLTAVLTGFTGYIIQGNYESQWIAQQGKDAFNAIGFGWVLNAMSFDNAVGWHIALLPLAVGILIGLHLLWVRRHGVVPPFPAAGTTIDGEPDPDGPSRNDSGSGTRAGTAAVRPADES